MIRLSATHILWGAIIAILAVQVAFSAFLYRIAANGSLALASHFGDAFGVLNCLLSALTLIGVAMAIYFQHSELKEARRDSEIQRLRSMRENTLIANTTCLKWANGNKASSLLRIVMRNEGNTVFRLTAASVADGNYEAVIEGKNTIEHLGEFQVRIRGLKDERPLDEYGPVEFRLYYLDLDGNPRTQEYFVVVQENQVFCKRLGLTTIDRETVYRDN